MITADLNFTGTHTPPALDAVDLNFGTSDTGIVDPATFALVMSKAAPVAAFAMSYASNVSRPVGILPDFPWQPSKPLDDASEGGWAQASTDRSYRGLPWQRGKAVNDETSSSMAELLKSRTAPSLHWGVAARLFDGGFSEGFEQLERTRKYVQAPWDRGAAISRSNETGFVQLLPFKHNREQLWGLGRYITALQILRADVAKPWKVSPDIPWSEARKMQSGREAPVVQPPVDPYDPSYDLNFLCKCVFPDIHAVMLNFGLHPCPTPNIVPARKVYFIVNSISLKRVSDNEPVGIHGATVGIDNNSWCWSFSATIPYNHLDRVEPTALGPVEVELEINGIVWRFLVEEYDEKKQFGKTDISIKGRSVTAYLESPYAPVRSFTQSTTLNSRQFAEAELTRAGLITGFTLDWQLIDALGWQMPANTWSYNDLTPIQVIQAIAQGAGGFVNSHPATKQLLVLPEYPDAPWDWASATIAKTIPKTLIKNQNLRWTEKPLYNGVYVSGENTGVTAFVKRTGTAGDFQAPMFVNPMISATAAARSKGKAILSAGGKQAQVGLELPMEPTLGLLTPGMLIEVTNGGYGTEAAWRGLVRSTAISAAWGDGLTVSQSIDLERHYGGL